MKKKGNKICIRDINGILMIIDINEIINFEKHDKHIKINILNGSKEVYINRTMKSLFIFLNDNMLDNFYKSHYSFIININHIKCVNSKVISMTNNIKIPISNRYKENLMNSIKNRFLEIN